MVLALTAVHVAISLIAIVAGVVVLRDLLAHRAASRWTGLFLVTTILTSATGFLFPVEHLLPSHIVAILSLIALAFAVIGRYPKQLAGGWRTVYIGTAALSFYLNVFVLIVQSFQKVPALHTLAPTGSEPPFVVLELLALAGVAFVALRAGRPAAVRADL